MTTYMIFVIVPMVAVRVKIVGTISTVCAAIRTIAAPSTLNPETERSQAKRRCVMCQMKNWNQIVYMEAHAKAPRMVIDRAK